MERFYQAGDGWRLALEFSYDVAFVALVTHLSALSRMQQRQTSSDDLESKLAGFVRSYIHASKNGESLQAEEALRWVCSGMEYLLGSLLDDCKGWHGWVDGIIPATDILPDAITVSSNIDLSVCGQAVWGERSQGPFWIEPFLGSVQIAETHDVLGAYEIHFGDAARGLAKFPHDKHVRRVDWFSPGEWLFVFSKGSLRKKSIRA
jgi:hypothetical protein